MADNDKNVFGSLRNFIAEQAQRKLESDMMLNEARRSAAEKLTPTKAQAAWIGSIFAPGSAGLDAAGKFPEFPSSDVDLVDAFSGDPMPGISENIAAGGIDRYLVAPLQGLGVLGDAAYAAPVVGPFLGPTVGSVLKGVGALSAVPAAISKAKKTTTGIEALKGTDATKAALKENLDKFAKDQYNFVSPSLEALLKSAPPNLKGKQITEWLNANANKGVKPKELEYLGVDDFVASNPKATVNEVVEGVSGNKVVVGKNTYRGSSYGQANVEFEVTTPELDPLDGSVLWNPMKEDILYDPGNYDVELLESFNKMYPRNKQSNWVDAQEQISLGFGNLEDVSENAAKARYQDNPYELIQPSQTQGIEGPLEDTFAFGNDDVGYQIFIGGQRATDQNNIAYSRAEAQIQLQTKLENDNLLDIVDEGARYKNYIDETLPGGEDYREIVFTWENAPTEHGVQDHFDEVSQISHALVRNRKLADGKKTLHVDELQSDLHTKGSRDGYATDETQKTLRKKIAAKEKQIQAELDKINPAIKKSMESFEPPVNAAGTPYVIGSAIRSEDATPSGVKQNMQENIDRFYNQIKDTRGRVRQMHLNDFLSFADKNRLLDTTTYDRVDGLRDILFRASETEDKFLNLVPNYPFKDDWYAMSLKQLLKDAIDEGSDAISVSSSAPIKARYTDEYSKFYETLYDRKIPSAMKKLANKYGGKFEKGSLDKTDTFGDVYKTPQGEPYNQAQLDTINKAIAADQPNLKTNIIRITPEMKAKILEEGLPSFAFGGPVFKPFSIDNIDIFNP